MLAALRQIGWNGDTAEVLEAYTRSKKLVRALAGMGCHPAAGVPGRPLSQRAALRADAAHQRQAPTRQLTPVCGSAYGEYINH